MHSKQLVAMHDKESSTLIWCTAFLSTTLQVAAFFRTELLAAAAAATAESQRQQQAGAAAVAAAEAQPVILLTNDNAQLALAKSHGLPAFKLAGGGAACVVWVWWERQTGGGREGAEVSAPLNAGAVWGL